MKKFITPYRVGVSVLLAAAFAMLYVGFTSFADPDPQEATQRDQRVETVKPDPGGTALRQSLIFAKLAPNFTGILVVDGKEIPEDQLDHSEGLDTVAFTPGPGTETGELTPGKRCATVVYWPATSTREASSQNYSWCWQVH